MKIQVTDLVSAVTIASFTLIVILFVGKPDLHDVLMYRLSDGQIPIPASDPPKP